MAGIKTSSKPVSRTAKQKAVTSQVASTGFDTPAKTVAATKATGSLHKDKENIKKAQVVIHWAKPEHFHLTDSLLTLVEDSVTWKVALGFDKGASVNPTPTGKGKSLNQHYSDIAEIFFLGDTSLFDAGFIKGDLPMLTRVIKNRMTSLKSTYAEHRKTLGETGHGLVTTCHAGDIQDGSEMANAWDLIKEKFPWYLRINELMGGSPISSRKAISNSQSSLDLTVLGTENDEVFLPWSHTPTPMLDEDTPSQSMGALSPLSNLYGDDAEDDIDPSPKLKLVIPSKHSTSESTSSQPSKKRKSPQDLLKEVADAERDAHLAMNAVNAKQRIAREEIKRKSAHETAITIERMRIQAQSEQAAADHAHELQMMEKKIELARIQSGTFHSSFAIDPSLQ